MSITQAQTVPLPRLSDDLAFLDVVTEWDTTVAANKMQPQLLVPATFRPLVLPRIIAVANQKGGAGKTTTTVELAAALVARGLTVRVIGADPQRASLPEWLLPQYPEGLEPKKRMSLAHVFFRKCTLADATYPTRYRGLWIVPGGSKLGRVESENTLPGREGAIGREIAVDRRFDVDIIDCGPTLGIITVSALSAADDLIVPTQAGRFDMLGVSDLHNSWTTVRDTVNPKLELRAVVLNEWDRTKVMQATMHQIAKDYPHAVLAPLRRSVKVVEAVGEYQPTRVYAPRDNASRDMDQFAGVMFAPKAA
ncbi:ParA family protein [Streptomyces sp. PsTaAH-124]|uniref:ParA family protein n=1 Tax=Streptomyces sp. PsTaAH-124 TaxID=1157638 RepID=UPI0003A78464|nr:AAA family ATPase [Streptomyces sp. PsTaAH-124]